MNIIINASIIIQNLHSIHVTTIFQHSHIFDKKKNYDYYIFVRKFAHKHWYSQIKIMRLVGSGTVAMDVVIM